MSTSIIQEKFEDTMWMLPFSNETKERLMNDDIAACIQSWYCQNWSNMGKFEEGFLGKNECECEWQMNDGIQLPSVVVIKTTEKIKQI